MLLATTFSPTRKAIDKTTDQSVVKYDLKGIQVKQFAFFNMLDWIYFNLLSIVWFIDPEVVLEKLDWFFICRNYEI